MSQKIVERIGVDIGGVIIDREKAHDSKDTAFHAFNSDKYLETKAVPDSMTALHKLVRRFGRPNVYLISKANENTARKTMEWFAHYHVCATTGIDPTNIHFCDTRPEKGPICQQFGITHFVDDHIENLSIVYTAGVEHLFYFRPVLDRDAPKFALDPVFSRVIRVANWQEVLHKLGA